MQPLIECVPNISEGRSERIVSAICAPVERTPGVTLLDRTSDADHNRSVLTLAGDPESLKAAVLTLYEAALPRIDLRHHEGKHPRMGAVDVVPFIPIRGATMADCVHLARETAEAVAARFTVPIYLYAEAATTPERKVLANIRKGEFEGLAAKMEDPKWKPDFGPARPHPSAGASAIGARFFLIAYNLQLDTADVKVAKEIAKAVRASSGGLPFVQAMGLYLADRDCAQVSMNLLNYEETPIYRVQEAVKVEAAKRGARVIDSELVGLVPEAALLDSAAHYLQIQGWRPEMTIERAILAKQSGATGENSQ